MICAVMQPTFFPWLGYFDLIDSVDTFVFYDDVQFVKQSWQVRNRIKTSNGINYIFLPVLKSDLGTKIENIIIDNRKPWKKKLLKTLFFNYRKAKYADEVYHFLEAFFEDEYEKLSHLNINLIQAICNKISIETNFIESSILKKTTKIKDERLVQICLELGCDAYLSTQGSASYIEKEQEGGAFTDSKVSLFYHNYTPIIYKQSFGNFEPYMSIIDLLFNEGFSNSLSIIRKGRGSFLISKNLKNE